MKTRMVGTKMRSVPRFRATSGLLRLKGAKLCLVQSVGSRGSKSFGKQPIGSGEGGLVAWSPIGDGSRSFAERSPVGGSGSPPAAYSRKF